MPMDQMTEQQTMCLRLEGEIDHHRARQLMDELSWRMDREMPRQVELDLSGVTFMDSSGIALLVRLDRQCAGMGSALSVTHIPKQAGKVLRAARLEQRLHLSFD